MHVTCRYCARHVHVLRVFYTLSFFCAHPVRVQCLLFAHLGTFCARPGLVLCTSSARSLSELCSWCVRRELVSWTFVIFIYRRSASSSGPANSYCRNDRASPATRMCCTYITLCCTSLYTFTICSVQTIAFRQNANLGSLRNTQKRHYVLEATHRQVKEVPLVPCQTD